MYNDPFGGLNPYSGLVAQLEKQLEELKGMNRQAAQQVRPGFDPAFTNMIRSEVELYLQQRQQPAPQNPMQMIAAAISESISGADMELIATNIQRIPEWIRSTEGKEFAQLAADSIKKHLGGSNGADTATTVAAETRNTA